MRAAGVRGLLIYCSDYHCSHWTAISGDRWQDDVRLSDSGARDLPARLAVGVALMCGPTGNRLKPMPDKGFSGRAMRILSAIIQIEDDGSTALCDMIEYRGEMWLVPEWLPGSRPKTERPARIILVARRELLGLQTGPIRL